jgi:hypothetical protein
LGKSRVVGTPCGVEAVCWNNADSNTAGYSRYRDDPLHVLEASIDLLELVAGFDVRVRLMAVAKRPSLMFAV